MKYRLCVLFLLVLPASATISYVRSNTQWSGGTTSCSVSLATTGSPDLIVAWGEWQTSGPNTVTATATQGQAGKTIVSAVGPTVQSASNTAAQIFYVPNITTGGETVTLTFGGTGTVTSSACVIVEYSGADTVAPLDSVSEAISNSTSPSNALDSGTASPANASLLVFGAGVVDNTSGLIAGSGFTSVQSSTIGTAASAITEQNTAAINTNNVLQRATACIGTPCSTNTGDWIMQMAVFRAATWTGAQGTSSTRFHGVVDASQFPGTDGIGAAIASLPACSPYSQCGTVYVPQGTYTFTSTLTVPIGVALKLDRNAILQCDVRDSMQKTICVQMQNASTLDCGGGTGSNSYGVAGAAIVGLSTTSARAGGPDLRR